MKMLLIDSSVPINNRNAKIIDSIKAHLTDCSIDCVTWDRDGDSDLTLNNYHIYRKRSPLGNQLKKGLNLFGYYKFVKGVYERGNYDVVIASHWENLLIASIIKKKGKLIYENLDIPTSNSGVIRIIERALEKKALKKTDAIVFASRFFMPLYLNFKGNHFLLENKPLFENSNSDKNKIMAEAPLVISYIGIVRYKEIMKNLVEAVIASDNVQLYINGSGPDLDYVRSLSQGCDKITITGKYDQQELKGLYDNAHLVWAAYPNKDYNVKYAISNKFHETLFFGVPGVFSENTKLGEFITENGIGYTVDPYSIDSIKNLFKHIHPSSDEYKQITERIIDFSSTQSDWDTDIEALCSYISKQ